MHHKKGVIEMRKTISIEDNGSVHVHDDYSSAAAMFVAGVLALGGTAIFFPPLLPVALKVVGGMLVTTGKIMIGVSVTGIAVGGIYTLVKDKKKIETKTI
jgi:5-enolpyruvylshikimate-3-phosphate synthase